MKRKEFKMTEILAWQSYLAVLALLLALFAAGEELRDVWHYDLGVTRISELTGANRHELLRGNLSRFPKGGQRDTKLAAKLIQQENLTDTTRGAYGSGEEYCNFQGQNLRVAVSPQPPFVNCIQNLYGDWLCNGSNIELIHVLEQRFNFHADWVVLANNHLNDDDSFGLGRKLISKSGSSADRRGLRGLNQSTSNANLPKQSGIFNLVSTGRVLLSANGVMKTIDRTGQKLIVSSPFDSFKLHFLLSKSVRDHDHIFIKPFDPKAWLTILCSAALIVPVFYFINTTTAYYSTLDDKTLSSVSMKQCLHHTRQLMSRNLLMSRRSFSVSSSTDVLLEKEITRMMELSALSKAVRREPPPQLPIGTIESSYAAASQITAALRVPRLPAPLVKFENARKRRLARHQWARERKIANKASRRRRKSGFFKIAYIIWYVVASLANQGGETEDLPHADSTRILIAFWWLYMIVICAIHSGILTAILTFPKQIDFIQTLDDYMNLEPGERDTIRLTVDKFGELAHLLSDPDNLHKSPLQEFRKQHVPIAYVNFERNRQRILDEIQIGRSALIEEKSFITQIISREYYDSKQTKCLFKSSRYPIEVIPMSLILSEKMPQTCIEAINALLRRIMKTGLAQKWRRKYEAPGNDCLNTVVINAGDVDQIELKHVILAFWLLALGAFVGLLFLIIEIVWLFTIDDEEDDDDADAEDASLSGSQRESSLFFTSSSSSSSSSSSLASSSSDESNRVKLGLRRPIDRFDTRQSVAMRSLETARRRVPIRMMLRKTRRNQRRINAPKITFALEDEIDDHDEHNTGQDAIVEGDKKNSIRSSFILVLDEKEGLKEVKELYSSHSRERRNKRAAREAERRAKRLKKTVNLVKRIHDGKMYSERLKSRIRRMSQSVANHLQSKGSTSMANSRMQNDLERVHKRQTRGKANGQLFSGGRIVPI